MVDSGERSRCSVRWRWRSRISPRSWERGPARWEGGGTGRFDLTIESGSDGQPTGGVSVGTDQGDYTAKFKQLSFDGQNMKARYEFPLDSQADVVVTGTFNGGAAEGTWSLVPKDGDQVFAGGRLEGREEIKSQALA